eukprot:1583530-Lingulodinium_polyedra.AAC.1
MPICEQCGTLVAGPGTHCTDCGGAPAASTCRKMRTPACPPERRRSPGSSDAGRKRARTASPTPAAAQAGGP